MMCPPTAYRPFESARESPGHAHRAPKEQVQRAVQRELRLEKLPEPPDVADALAIALCHYHRKHVV